MTLRVNRAGLRKDKLLAALVMLPGNQSVEDFAGATDATLAEKADLSALAEKADLSALAEKADLSALAGKVSSADLTSTDSDKGAAIPGYKVAAPNAIDRKAKDKLDEQALTLEDFGAKGNNSTSDYKAFVDACAASAALDLPIKLLGKTYFIEAPNNSGTIINAATFAMYGQGKGRSAIRLSGQQAGLELVGSSAWRPTASLAYNPPSLAAGASVQVVMNAPTARLGQPAEGYFRINGSIVAGITTTASVTADGEITATITNTSGGTLDAGAGILTVLSKGAVGGPDDDRGSLSLRGFSIYRSDADLAAGSGTAKTIRYTDYVDVTITDVELYNNLGFALQSNYCDRVSVYNCYLHDSKGGSGGPIGSDGIHFYNSRSCSAYDNVIHSLGDDGISFGAQTNHFESVMSFYPAEKNRAWGNEIYDTLGGIKFFGASFSGQAFGNTIRDTTGHGIAVYSDNGSSSVQQNVGGIDIFNNQLIRASGGAGAFAAIYLYNGVGAIFSGITYLQDVRIGKNYIEGGNGYSIAAFTENSLTKQFRRITIDGADIKDAAKDAIYIVGASGRIDVKATVNGTAGRGIYFFRCKSGAKLYVQGCSLSGITTSGIQISADARCFYRVVGNELRDPAATGKYPFLISYTVTPDTDPLSELDDLTYDPSKFIAPLINGQIPRARVIRTAARPTTGTFYEGQEFLYTSATSGNPQRELVTATGTFGATAPTFKLLQNAP